MQFNEIDSELMTIRTVVLAGSILGALAFLICANNITNVLNLFHVILFPDATSLVGPK